MGGISALAMPGVTVTINSQTIQATQFDGSTPPLVTECNGTVTITNGGAGYAKGCRYVKTNAAGGTDGVYENIGTSASCQFITGGETPPGDIALPSGEILVGNSLGAAAAVAMTGDIAITNAGVTTIQPSAVTGAKMITGKGPFLVAVVTNGTTPVNVFGGPTIPFSGTITGVFLSADDVTAGTITLADTAGTVATIAKGTTAGALTGATSLANTALVAGNACTVVSSSAGNATVYVAVLVN